MRCYVPVYLAGLGDGSWPMGGNELKRHGFAEHADLLLTKLPEREPADLAGS